MTSKTIYVLVSGKVERIEFSTENTSKELKDLFRSLVGLGPQSCSPLDLSRSSHSSRLEVRLKDYRGLPLIISPVLPSNRAESPYILDVVVVPRSPMVTTLNSADSSSTSMGNRVSRKIARNHTDRVSNCQGTTSASRCLQCAGENNTSRSHSTASSRQGSPEETLRKLERRICALEERLQSLHMSPGKCDDSTTQELIHSVERIRGKVESYAHLSWLGVYKEPHPSQLCVPGRSCPLPNPDLGTVRRSEFEWRQVVKEYRQLNSKPLSDSVRQSLRTPTFNNWNWSDAGLLRLVKQMYLDLELDTKFGLEPAVLDNWLLEVYRRYNQVPFHNFKHAYMVAQMMYAIIWCADLPSHFDLMDLMILITSAISHDLDHPGFNNAYQINAGTQLALLYNDNSPLENHHAAVAFDILFQRETNIFHHLPRDKKKYIREGMIRCILATDMARHNDILAQFKDILPQLDLTNKEHRDLVMMILIKVSDISNESRPLDVASPWIDCLLEEFFHQSDMEKVEGLPVAPFMDRDKVTKAASQCGFIQYVLLPMFEASAEVFPKLQEVVVDPAIRQLEHYTELMKLETRNGVSSSSTESRKSSTTSANAGAAPLQTKI